MKTSDGKTSDGGAVGGAVAAENPTQVAACPPGPFSRDRTGEVIGGRYRLLRLLGTGGMGTVYLAEHMRMSRSTALKLLLPALCTDEYCAERFRREASLASRINHPSVAQVYDFDVTPDGGFFLAMEYVDGESLAQRLHRSGPLGLNEARRILDAVAAGLDVAHALKIVHRDIKPGNLMLSAAGAVKILDFGVARLLDIGAALSRPGLLLGTPLYMSPEQLLGHDVGPAADIYALGLVVYEMLTGSVPGAAKSFEEVRARRTTEMSPRLHEVRRECSPQLSETVTRALDLDPAARWSSASAFAAAVAEAITQDGTAPTTCTLRPEPASGSAWDRHFMALRLAGREREVQTVRAACATAMMGRTGVLWIEGEEGSGKSSLFDVALREAAAAGATILVGRGFKTDVPRPYGPWLSVLREARQRVPGCSLPVIDVLSGSPCCPPLPADRAVFYDEVSALFRSAAEAGPLLIGIDGLDWCDPVLQALVAYLPIDVPRLPILLVVTVQSESVHERPELRDLRSRVHGLEAVHWVMLKALRRRDVAAWLSTALGRDAPDALVDHVYGHSEGNAFFIEQVMRGLVERQEIDHMTEETARLTLAEAPPPEAVADTLKRRLGGLGDAERETLQVAAVIGRAFDLDLVIAILERPEDTVLHALDEAVQRGILVSEGSGAVDRYRFTHRMIRDVLVQELSTRRRRRLHARIAAALATRPEVTSGEKAWHWFQAGDSAKACAAAETAAGQALSVHDYDGALTYAVMAEQVAGSPAERFRAHALRGDALRRLDRPVEASRAYAEAGSLGYGDPAAVFDVRLSELRESLEAGTVAPAAVAARLAALQQGTTELSPRERADLCLLQAEVNLACGQAVEAECVAIAAFDLATQCADPAQAGEALLALAGAQLAQAKLPAAAHSAQSACDAFLELGCTDGAARGHLLLGSVATARHDAAAAAAALAEALRLAELAGIPRLFRQIQQRQHDLVAGGGPPA